MPLGSTNTDTVVDTISYGNVNRKTISIGSLCATLLILFVLPGVLAVCDKIVTKKRNRV